MSITHLRVATRGSALALAQAELTRCLLQSLVPDITIGLNIVRTAGDDAKGPLAAIGGVGVFVKELERTLLEGGADVAVHSLKDLPTILPHRLTLAAILEREDPSDAWVSREGYGLDQLAPGSVVGTGSPRRKALVLARRPDLVVKDIRGNVDTRLEKLARGDYDAIVLARAGLVRLGRAGVVTEVLNSTEFLPAPGQGAIALEVVAGSEVAALVARLDHRDSRRAVMAERAFLLALGGGCAVPIGALALLNGDRIELFGVVADAAGGELLRDHVEGELSSIEAGQNLARQMNAMGALRLLGRCATPLAGRRVMVLRRGDAGSMVSPLLEAAGAEVVEVKAVATVPETDPDVWRDPLSRLSKFAMIALTSQAAAESLLAALAASGYPASQPLPTVAAVGSATAAVMESAGHPPAIVGSLGARALATAIIQAGCDGPLLWPRSDRAARDLAELLAAAGIEVFEVEAYRTVTAPHLEEEIELLSCLAPFDAIVGASPSALTSLLKVVPENSYLRSVIVSCIGPTTAAAARTLGFRVAPAGDSVGAEAVVGGLVRHFANPDSEGDPS